jgi:hypothetical protein
MTLNFMNDFCLKRMSSNHFRDQNYPLHFLSQEEVKLYSLFICFGNVWTLIIIFLELNFN